MSIDEKAFREQQERLMAENVRLRAEVERLQGPFTCKHDPAYIGGACAACHVEYIARTERVESQYQEAIKALDEAHSVERCPYNGYGRCLPCNVLRASRKPKDSGCIDDQHRGTECKCCHMIYHCCSHHCCCFYRCKTCRHAESEHEKGPCSFGDNCNCKAYSGERR